MAVTGTFLSDFNDFVRGAGQAQEALNRIKESAGTVEQSVNQVSFTGWLRDLPVVGQLIAAISAERLLEFARGAIEAASRVDDLARATGATADAIQRFTYVGSEFHVGMEEMGRAIEQFSARLGSGDKSARAAVEALGLNVKELIKAGPVEAFLQWADAAGRIDDEFAKGGNAAEVLGGKLAKVLLPVLGDLRQHFNEVPKEALISDDNIKAADRFDDAMAHLAITAKAATVNLLTLPIHIYDAYHKIIANQIEDTPKATQAIIDMAVSHEQAGKAAQEHITKTDLLNNTIKAWRTEALEPLNQTQKETVELGLSLGRSQAEIAKALDVSEGAVHRYAEAQKKATESIRDQINAEIERNRIVAEGAKIRDERRQEINKTILEGFEAIRKAESQLQDFENATWMSMTDYQITLIWKRADEAVKSFKGTEDERARFASITYQNASREADALYLKDYEYAQKTIKSFKDLTDAEAAAVLDNAKWLDYLVDKQKQAKQAQDQLTQSLKATAGVLNLEVAQAYAGYAEQLDKLATRPGSLLGFTVGAQVQSTITWYPSRDAGGSGQAGQAYYIGTGAQPELFVPASSGTFIPNSGGSTGPQIIQLVVDGRVLSEVVTNDLMRRSTTKRI